MAEQGKFIIEGIRKGIADKWTGFVEFWTKKKDKQMKSKDKMIRAIRSRKDYKWLFDMVSSTAAKYN